MRSDETREMILAAGWTTAGERLLLTQRAGAAPRLTVDGRTLGIYNGPGSGLRALSALAGPRGKA